MKPIPILSVLSIFCACCFLVSGVFGDATRTRIPEASAAEIPSTLPETLSQLGFFADLEALRPAEDVMPYEVNYPLWSDGSEKQRHIYLPPGSELEVLEDGNFIFPVGACTSKTFASSTDVAGRSHRKLETRVMLKTDAGWEFATYVWNEAGDDAYRSGGRDLELEHRLPGCESNYVVPDVSSAFSAMAAQWTPSLASRPSSSRTKPSTSSFVVLTFAWSRLCFRIG